MKNRFILVTTLFFYALSAPCQKKIDGHEYVDLGLSVLWATCNIGGNSPEEFGGYYAWGETYEKSYYSKITYKFSGGKDGFAALMDYTKYLGNWNKSANNDSKLDLCDDVAHVLWSGKWRMPTLQEFDELVNSCNWIVGELKGIKGYWAVSKINGNRIFFPLAGYIYYDAVTELGESGKYWTSELRPDMCFEAYQLWISFSDELSKMNHKSSVFMSDDGFRENGRSVRAVISK